MEQEYVITNPNGIHARPATTLVQKASKFQSEITLTYNGITVDLKSIMAVLSLGVTSGSTIIVRASGVDERDAIEEVSKFIIEINR